MTSDPENRKEEAVVNDWLDVCAIGEIAPGDFRTIWIHDIEVAVINVDGTCYAIEDVCTHDGGELTGGRIEGHEIECPRHGARFDIRTGAVLKPPAYEDVPTYAVRIRDGRVEVAVDAD